MCLTSLSQGLVIVFAVCGVLVCAFTENVANEVLTSSWFQRTCHTGAALSWWVDPRN